jgi:hypothetical protein
MRKQTVDDLYHLVEVVFSRIQDTPRHLELDGMVCPSS